MRRHNPQQREDDFALLRAHATEHLDDLIAEFHHEPDHGQRCWLLELIGHTRSPRALPLLIEQLNSPDEALRGWATAGLQLLDTPATRQTLHHARTNSQIT